MSLILVVLFLAVPFAELAVLIAVGQQIGIADTLLLMIGVSVAGAFMARRQGLGVLREIQRRLEAGEVPGKELVDGLVVLVAAVLLLTPGFITDGIALLMLVPFVRAGVRRVFRGRFERRVTVLAPPGPPDPSARGPRGPWIDVGSTEPGSTEGGSTEGGKPNGPARPGGLEPGDDEGSGGRASNS